MSNKIQKVADELLKQLEKAVSDEERADTLIKLSSTFRTSDPEKATGYAFEALELSESSGLGIFTAKAFMLLGIINYFHGDYTKALEYNFKALQKAEAIAEKKLLSDCMNNIGLIYFDQGDYPRALEYHQKALLIKEETEDLQGISACYNGIGSIYWHQGSYDTAREYYEKSLDIKRKLEDSAGIAICMNNIGASYQKQERYGEALPHYLKSLEIRRNIGDTIGTSYSLSNIGENYMYQGAYAKALEYFEKSLELNEELGEKNGIASCCINIGHLHLKNGDCESALEFLAKGLNFSIEIGSIDLKMDAYSGLSETHECLGDAKNALRYFKFYRTANEQLFGQEQTRKIAQLETRFELEKKQHEIEIWRKASVTDPLTKISNRQGLWNRIRAEMEKADANESNIIIALVDIDKFKNFNDTYGHDCGDAVLISVAKILCRSIGEIGHAGRWGGEEFLIVIPGMNMESGFRVIDGVRENIEKHVLRHGDKNLSVTASFGVAEYRKGADIDKTIKSADDALYTAKEQGRNCVKCSTRNISASNS